MIRPTALDHEEVEFLAFGNELVDGVVSYVRRREYPGRACHRRIHTNDVEPCSGWLFVYALEFEGVIPSKEVFPVFVGPDGVSGPEHADWLLERSARVKREEWADSAPLPSRDDRFEQAVAVAGEMSLQRLLTRQSELAHANQERLDHERTKLERFYEYKEQAAADRLASVRGVYERLLISDDPDDAKILPVWAKNLDNAERLVENMAEERDRRIADLAGREQVAIQHELLAASYVEVQPDLSEEIGGLELPDQLHERVVGLVRPTSSEDLATLQMAVTERGEKLVKLSETKRFDPSVAVTIANDLSSALADTSSLRSDRALLRAAVDYFLLVDDEQHDLTAKCGFEDDRLVVQAVLSAIGQAD